LLQYIRDQACSFYKVIVVNTNAKQAARVADYNLG
jgi:ABC-type phosphate transport system ATPase subunit